MSLKRTGLCIPAVLPLGACATMAQDSARKEAMANCAEQGLRYLETGKSKKERVVVSTGGVEYYCVGPDHPDYAKAVDPNI